ncbi:helix-turn-helix domain-containing protein [Leptobacterium flavescens]|uniref:Helix-turn-helix domain-containing protein n=1 Tax=Leptobacterium flavescens TaxID=472055 RepID=A0A6P0UMI3_9FLAO|nr:helix-turn-helix domain-containing protein [Leptobacterium flavescens]NER14227.1 helix-turn-helix domain-containing protein [Leptobacterium flavescens]
MKKLPVYTIDRFETPVGDRNIYINNFRDHLKTHSFIKEPHGHDFHLLVLFTRGKGMHEIDFNRYPIQKGSVFMLQPGQMHHWELSDDIDGYILFHSREIYNLYFGQKNIDDYPFYYSVYNTPFLTLNKIETQKVKSLFEHITEEYSKEILFKNHVFLNTLDMIYIELSRKYIESNTHKVHSYSEQLRKLENLIDLYYREHKSPSFYADKMNISLKHTNRICKSTLNKTLTQIIGDRLILEAKRMLLKQHLSVSEIAAFLGFTDYSYFSRLFKSNSGETPSDFRKKYKLRK